MTPWRIVYNTGVVLGAALTAPLWGPYLIGRPKHRAGMVQKITARVPPGPASPTAPIWYHAVSVGEVMASLPLIREILRRLPDRPLWISTVTATGQVTARSRVPEAAGIFYLPYDLPWTVDRVIHRLRPGLFITAETELWPNLVWRLHRYGVPMAMVNGRISDRSYPRYRRFRFLFSPVVRCFDLLCMQSDLSAWRVRAMGALPERVRVAGNLKFDQPIPEAVDSGVWRGRLGIRGREPVWVAGSTHPGEEEALLRVLSRVREHHPDLRLVVAPRAPERFGEVEALARRMGFSVLRRSEAEGSRGRVTDVILLDTIGELAQVYGIAGVGFVGGSLIPKGGHNPLEVAAHGCPVLFGPHMENFREIASLLSEGGGAWEVAGEEMLEGRMMELLADPRRAREMGARAREVLASHRGAARRTLGMIQPLLERNPWD